MKIPENAKRVFKGVIFEIHQWDQKMPDGSTATFEMVKRPDTVQVMVTKGDPTSAETGKILITNEQQPLHTREPGLFGGMVDPGEESLAAAKRELMEESGMIAQEWELWKTYEPVMKMDWTIYFYIARGARKAAEPKPEPGEKIVMKEVNFEEFVELFSNNKFWGEFANDILRMKLEGRLEDFRKKLFP